MSVIKFLDLSGVNTLLNQLKNIFVKKSDVDSALSSTSTNPVQNKVVNTALNGKLNSNANAVSSSKLQTARTITLSGDVTGSTSFDGSKNVTITATVKDDSHNHTIANVDSLQSTLDGKVPTSRTINGKALTSNITLTASDVGAYTEAEVDDKIDSLSPLVIVGNTTNATATGGWYKALTIPAFSSGWGTYSIRLLIAPANYVNFSFQPYTVDLKLMSSGTENSPNQRVFVARGDEAHLDKLYIVQKEDEHSPIEIWYNNTSQFSQISIQVLSGVSRALADTLLEDIIINDTDPRTAKTSYTSGYTAHSFEDLKYTTAVPSADKLATARTISLTGDITGSTTFDGSKNISITATVKDDSHNHTIANIDNLQTTLNNKIETLSDLGITATATELNYVDGVTSNIQTQINNLKDVQIGGRNWLTNTEPEISQVINAPDGHATTSTISKQYTPGQKTLAELGFKSGDTVTLSFDWKISSATTYGTFKVEFYGYKSTSSDTYLGAVPNSTVTLSSSNTSGHCEITFDLTSTTINTKRFVFRIDDSVLTITISYLKLEKGSKATDWTPAPEDKLSTSGGTITGTLTLSKTTDAAGGSNNSPALIVGGTATSGHIEIDANEILAKTNGTTPTILNLNTDGGQVKVGSGGFRSVGEATFDDVINSSKVSQTFLAGNQGEALINSTATAGSYVMLAKLNSTSGYFTHGVYQKDYKLQYTAKSTVDAGTNAVTKTVTLLNESGNTSFPGTVTAPTFSGTATKANQLTTARTINGTSFNGTANITTANWGTTRTIKIGDSSKSVNGSANVTWTLAEIGAATDTHTHNYAGSSSAGGAANSAVKATSDSLGQNIADTYIKALSVSGRTITYTKGDGGTGTITTQDTNTDTKATQTNTTTNADYRLVLSTNANDTTETNTLRKSTNFRANPSTGAFYAKGYDRIDITGQTVNINTYTLSAGSPEIMRYIEKTNGGAANITNIPVEDAPFLLDVELIRWASATDYVTMQTFRSINQKTYEYVRYCTSGTWSGWTTRKFTDTTYSLSSFGITATAAEINKLDGLATTKTELGYLDGVTSNVQTQLNGKLSTSGTAAKATILATARTINGTSFNGSANITTANWGTTRAIKIGNTSKNVNGSANVTWTLSEIGAAASSHTHSYLPLSGGTVTGTLQLTRTTDSAAAANNKPALMIGDMDGQHLELDGNEIMSKASGTTTGSLGLNLDGGLVTIGSGGLKVNGNAQITGNITCKNSTDYTTSRARNARFGTSKPSSLNNGEIFFVYE